MIRFGGPGQIEVECSGMVAQELAGKPIVFFTPFSGAGQRLEISGEQAAAHDPLLQAVACQATTQDYFCTVLEMGDAARYHAAGSIIL